MEHHGPDDRGCVGGDGETLLPSNGPWSPPGCVTTEVSELRSRKSQLVHG